MLLRDYQGEGYNDIWREWMEHDILMFLLTTGGGKTVTFVEVIRRILMMGKRVLLIAHREELIAQAWQTLYDGEIYAGIIMGDRPTNYALPAQVCSIQTIARRNVLPAADFLIFDEGHHATLTNTYGKTIARYPSAKVLLVTATSYRLSGEGFRYLHSYKPTKLIVNRTLKELQAAGWLVPLRYYASHVPDLTAVHLSKGDYKEEEARKAMELVPIVDSYMADAKGKCGVVFTVNIAHSIHTVQRYLHAGVPAEHLDAKTPDHERKRILSDFRCGLAKVISNVGIITEGFDFPSMEFVQLARPTKSLSMYCQMVGRVTRPEGGLVDRFATAPERLLAIERSGKPAGIVLDNAGCWMDNNPVLDWDFPWATHFMGTAKAEKKKQDVDEEIEMLVFVAEDGQGRVVRTNKVKEIEGMRLIEVTKEIRRKIVNLTSMKEFDRLYNMFKRLPNVKKPGYTACRDFIAYCKKNRILMVPEVWDYLRRQLVDIIEQRVEQMAKNREGAGAQAYPVHLYAQNVEAAKAQGVSGDWLRIEQRKYMAENREQFEGLAGHGDKNKVVQGKVL